MKGKSKISPIPVLLIAVAFSGMAVFAANWNSFLLGKSKIYLSLAFLAILLLSVGYLYLLFTKLPKVASENNVPEKKDPDEIPENDNPDIEKNPSRSLLKSVFTKNDIKGIGEKILRNLATEFEIVQGIFFFRVPGEDSFKPVAYYAYYSDKPPKEFISGEGITGQAVADNKITVIQNIPDDYGSAISGLGSGKAKIIYIIPLVHEKESLAVVEISCFKEIDEERFSMLSQLMREGGPRMAAVLSAQDK
ncbi:MAG: GAF domain-containing protein [Bacteroidales bacterium]|nr:GAF domain-containing protein [Bacteroidales bacterium]MCB9012644.1 GAF domain-containing protein [Bacteroidales bacterium]